MTSTELEFDTKVHGKSTGTQHTHTRVPLLTLQCLEVAAKDPNSPWNHMGSGVDDRDSQVGSQQKRWERNPRSLFSYHLGVRL